MQCDFESERNKEGLSAVQSRILAYLHDADTSMREESLCNELGIDLDDLHSDIEQLYAMGLIEHSKHRNVKITALGSAKRRVLIKRIATFEMNHCESIETADLNTARKVLLKISGLTQLT